MVIADQSPLKANDELALELARQHSIEVDSAKSGVHGTIP